jgi:hypothetical protein
VRAEKLSAFHADGPIAKSCAFGGAGNNTDMVRHDIDSTKAPRVSETRVQLFNTIIYLTQGKASARC